MKKLLTLVLVIGSTVFSQAQTNASEVNWLQTNKSELDFIGCPSKALYGGHIEVTNDYIKLFDDQTTCKIAWKEVINVTNKGEFINIASNQTVNNSPVELLMYVKNEQTKENFINVLNNIADINKIKLVKK